jgi:hypothetical protein
MQLLKALDPLFLITEIASGLVYDKHLLMQLEVT